MKKKTPPRLTLSRETLRRLEPSTLKIAGVGGYFTSEVPTGSKDFYPCHETDHCYY